MAELKPLVATAQPSTRPTQPWHGDFAGNATDSVLILVALLLTFCLLSGMWWVALYTGFFILLATQH